MPIDNPKAPPDHEFRPTGSKFNHGVPPGSVRRYVPRSHVRAHSCRTWTSGRLLELPLLAASASLTWRSQDSLLNSPSLGATSTVAWTVVTLPSTKANITFTPSANYADETLCGFSPNAAPYRLCRPGRSDMAGEYRNGTRWRSILYVPGVVTHVAERIAPTTGLDESAASLEESLHPRRLCALIQRACRRPR